MSDEEYEKRSRREKKSQSSDMRCAYMALGQRCTFTGAMTVQVPGDSGPWYCRYHFRQVHLGQSEEEIADEIRNRRVKPKREWRDEAIDAKLEEMRDEPLMKMAKRLSKGGCSREDKTAFVGLLRERITGIGKKLPYEKGERRHQGDRG